MMPESETLRPALRGERDQCAPGRVKGFTLVELLVVVGIISVLVAMLLPSLKRAREQAQMIQCQSNLKQIYSGFVMYAQEFKDRIPPFGGGSTAGGGWCRYLGRRGYWGKPDYLRTTGLDRWPVLRCPSEPGSARLYGDWTYYDHVYIGTSYVMNFSVNRYIFDQDWAPPGGDAFRHGFFKGPGRGHYRAPKDRSDAFFIMDCEDMGEGWSMFYYYDIDSIPRWYRYTYDSGFIYAFRHVGRKANILCMDGHIETRLHVIDGGQPNFRELWDPSDPLP